MKYVIYKPILFGLLDLKIGEYRWNRSRRIWETKNDLLAFSSVHEMRNWAGEKRSVERVF